MSIALTMGTFDPWHTGHDRLVERMDQMFDVVHVAVNSDRFIREYKGREPYQSERERADRAAESPHVHHVHIRRESWDCRPLVLQVAPDFIVVGHDWAPPADYSAQTQLTGDFLALHNIGLLFLARTPGISSEMIRRDY